MYSMYKNPGFDSEHSSIISLGSKPGEISRIMKKNMVNSRRFFLLDQKHLKELSNPQNINNKSLFIPEDYSLDHKRDLERFHHSINKRDKALE